MEIETLLTEEIVLEEEAYLLGKYSFCVEKEIRFIANLAEYELAIKDFVESPFFEVLKKQQIIEMYVYYVQRLYAKWKDPIVLIEKMIDEQLAVDQIVRITQMPKAIIENISYARSS